MRDLIFDQRRLGKTVFFSSHILSDVETLCDRVAIVNQGKIVDEGSLSDLLESETLLVDIELREVSEELQAKLDEVAEDSTVEDDKSVVRLTVQGEDAVNELLALALENEAIVVSVVPRRETLESLFVRHAIKSTAD